MNRLLFILALVLFTSCTGHNYADSNLGTVSPINTYDKKKVDTAYLRTGFYFLIDEGYGVNKRKEGSDEIYSIASSPFASIKDVSKADFIETHLKKVSYKELYMKFNSKGTEAIKQGTGNPLHPKIAVIVANKLLYVVENTTRIESGIMSIALVGYSENEIEEMRNCVNAKR